MTSPRLARSFSTPPSIALVTFNDVPDPDDTLKYRRLGPMAIESHRRYARHHGYEFIDEVVIDRRRPACWAKIPALLDAFDRCEWVVWADADTLIVDRDRRLESFLAEVRPHHQLVVQSPREHFEALGVDLATAMDIQPLNTAVFFMRASDWSREFLHEAYDREFFVDCGERWNGIGEQEAMIDVLRRRADEGRVRYVEDLHGHPRTCRFGANAASGSDMKSGDGAGNMFAHFYGNNARYLVGADECERVITRWERAVERDDPWPDDPERLHWCCIQNRHPDAVIDRGEPDRFLYRRADIVGTVVSSTMT